jgi:histidyl-tRNA synthetase
VQLKYAEKRGIPLAIFYGKNEMEKDRYNLRELGPRRNHDDLSFEQLLERIAELLQAES